MAMICTPVPHTFRAPVVAPTSAPASSVFPVVIHGTTYYSADPAAYRPATQTIPAAPGAYGAVTYSSTPLYHSQTRKIQNGGLPLREDRPKLGGPKQLHRVPKTHFRGPLKNSTNVALKKNQNSAPVPYSQVSAPQYIKTPTISNPPAAAAVNRTPVQRVETSPAAIRRDRDGDTVMTDASTARTQAFEAYKYWYNHSKSATPASNNPPKALNTKSIEPASVSAMLTSSFLRNYLNGPTLYNIYDPTEAQHVAQMASVLTEPRSPAARLLLQFSPNVVLRLQRFMLVHGQASHIEGIAKDAKWRCDSYLAACDNGNNPRGGRAWLASRELKKRQPGLHKFVLIGKHRKAIATRAQQELGV